MPANAPTINAPPVAIKVRRNVTPIKRILATNIIANGIFIVLAAGRSNANAMPAFLLIGASNAAMFPCDNA